jgi:hypothetical protein
MSEEAREHPAEPATAPQPAGAGLEPDDLRAIVAAGKENGLSAYDALRKAGLIKPLPDDLLR